MGNNRISFEEGKIYHIYNHGNGDENIFRSDENRRYFMEKYAKYMMPIVDTFAYCLMPNHFHFLVRIKLMEELDSKEFENFADLERSKKISQIFSNFLNAYAKAFNKLYNRKGSLFLDNINRKLIDKEGYFSQVIYYIHHNIHHNPVKHGFVKTPQDWYWSSYHAFVETKPTKLCRDEVLNWFGDVSAFIKFHQNLPDKDFTKDWEGISY